MNVVHQVHSQTFERGYFFLNNSKENDSFFAKCKATGDTLFIFISLIVKSFMYIYVYFHSFFE